MTLSLEPTQKPASPHRNGRLFQGSYPATGCHPAERRYLHALALTVFSELDHTPRVKVALVLDQVLVQYTASGCSWSDHATFAKLRWHPDDDELWFFRLYVAPPFRRQGLGRRIALTCEKLGRQLGISRVSLLSLREARGFWRSLEYRPHPTLPRVLTKSLISEPLRTWALDPTSHYREDAYDHQCD